MSKIYKVEVYYNEWTDKWIFAPFWDDREVEDTEFKTVKTRAEVESMLDKFKELFPDVEIKIYE